MKRLLFGCATLLAIVPFAAGALTVDELRVQIENLIRQIDALQGQLGSGTPGTPVSYASNPGTVPASFDCPYISRSLRIGSSGSDVSRLQQFLAFNPTIYPEAQVTGYYGPLTEAAIRRFQCTNKIVCDGTPASTGYGVTGPRTASLLALQCAERAQQGQASGFIRVTPISGAAPLATTVEVTVNTTRSCGASSYELDFGDNTPRIPVNVPANACAEIRQAFTHTYVNGGVYVIVLRSGSHQVSATVNVSGGSGSSGDTFRVSAVSGSRPLTVSFEGTINVAGTCNSQPYSIVFGDGQSANLNLTGCTPNNYTVSHRYDSNGTFIARLMRGNTEVDRESIKVGSGSSGAGGGYFAITPGVGGDDFTMEAEFDLESSCARYTLEWGDGSSGSSQSQGSCSGGTSTKRLTHTYSDTGSFTITLRRGEDLEMEDSVAVSIVY